MLHWARNAARCHCVRSRSCLQTRSASRTPAHPARSARCLRVIAPAQRAQQDTLARVLVSLAASLTVSFANGPAPPSDAFSTPARRLPCAAVVPPPSCARVYSLQPGQHAPRKVAGASRNGARAQTATTNAGREHSAAHCHCARSCSRLQKRSASRARPLTTMPGRPVAAPGQLAASNSLRATVLCTLRSQWRNTSCARSQPTTLTRAHRLPYFRSARWLVCCCRHRYGTLDAARR